MNQNVPKGIVIGLLTLAVVVIVTGCFVLFKLQPHDSTKEGFLVTLEGTVTTESKDHLPQLVSAYYPMAMYGENRIGQQGRTIAVGDILWSGNTGKFSMTFRVPIETELIVTADSQGCLHERVHVSAADPVKELTLKHADDRCYREGNMPQATVDILSQAEESLDIVSDNLLRVEYNSPLKERVRENIANGKEELRQAKNAVSEDEKRIHVLRAFLLRERALFAFQLMELEPCLNKTLPLIQLNDSCFIVPLSEKKALDQANASFSYNKDRGFQDVRSLETNESLVHEIQYMTSERARLQDEKYACEEGRRVVLNSLNDQESICTARNYTIGFVSWSEKLAWLLLGILICILTYPSAQRWIRK